MVKINDQAPVDWSKFWRGPSRDRNRTPWVAPGDFWLHKAVLHPLQVQPVQGQRLDDLLSAAFVPFLAILVALLIAVIGSFI
jgi:hypothetical protein